MPIGIMASSRTSRTRCVVSRRSSAAPSWSSVTPETPKCWPPRSPMAGRWMRSPVSLHRQAGGIRAAAVRASALHPVLVGHYWGTEVHRAFGRRHAAPASQGASLPLRRRRWRPAVLLHHLRLTPCARGDRAAKNARYLRAALDHLHGLAASTGGLLLRLRGHQAGCPTRLDLRRQRCCLLLRARCRKTPEWTRQLQRLIVSFTITHSYFRSHYQPTVGH